MAWLTAVQIGLWAGAYALSYILREEEEKPYDTKDRGSAVEAKEGEVFPLVFGRARVRKAQIVMYQSRRPLREAILATAGERLYQGYDTLLGSKDGVIDYAMTFQLAFCSRPFNRIAYDEVAGDFYDGAAIEKIWVGDKILLNIRFTEDDAWRPGENALDYVKSLGGIAVEFFGPAGQGGGIAGSFYVNLGAYDQGSHPAGALIVSTGALYGAYGLSPSLDYSKNGGTPGVISIYFVGPFIVGESPSIPGFSIEVNACPHPISGATAKVKDVVGGTSEVGVDANPAAVIQTILTDPVHGLGISSDQIDMASFLAHSQTLEAEANGYSRVIDREMSGRDLVKEVLKQIDGVIYVDPTTQKITLGLVRDDYGAHPYGGLEVFDDNDVMEIMDYRMTSWDDVYTQVRIKYEDRASDYAERWAVAQDPAGSARLGYVKNIDLDYPGVKKSSLANAIASRELRFYSTPQILVKLRLNRRAQTLRPGQVFKWTSSEYGITNMVLRVANLEWGGMSDSTVIVECALDKYSSFAGVFADPPDGFIDGVFDRPDPVNVLDVLESPFAPEPDGGDNNAPDDGRIYDLAGISRVNYNDLLVNAGTSSGGDGASYYDASDKPLQSTPYGTLNTTYADSEGPYKDDSTGIVIDNVSHDDFIRNYSEDEIRRAENLVYMNGEFLSYERATDLGGGSFRLEGIWRGLFDTISDDHVAGDAVFLLGGRRPTGRTLRKAAQCDSGELRIVTEARAVTQTKASIPVYGGVTYRKRAQRPIRLTQFKIHDDGPDAVASTPEVDYAFIDDDPTGRTDVQPALGALTREAGRFDTKLDIWSNDMRGSWARRRRVKNCYRTSFSGDDADQAYLDGDATRIQFEGKHDTDVDWTKLQAKTVDGTYNIQGPTDFVNMALMPLGTGSVRAIPYRTTDAQEELPAWSAEEVAVEVHSCRNLLVNRDFRRYWDIDADGSGIAIGKGVFAKGDYRARGWNILADGTNVALTFEDTSTYSIYQDANNYMTHAALTFSTANTQYELLEQVVAVPYEDSEGHEVYASVWGVNGTATEFTLYIKLETLDENGDVLESFTSAGTASSSNNWRKDTATRGTMSAGVKSIRMTILGETSTTGTAVVTKASLVMGAEVDSNLLGNSNFGALTAWSIDSGSWTSSAANRGLSPLVDDNMARCAGTGALSQSYALSTANIVVGDYMRVQVWAASADVGNRVRVRLQALDSVSAVITENDTGFWEPQKVDQWYFVELYLKVPENTVDINVVLEGEINTGFTIVGFDECDLTHIRQGVSAVEFDFGTTFEQPQPATPQEFSDAVGDPAVRPYAILKIDENPGQNLKDAVSGIEFDTYLGTKGTDVRVGAKAVGLWDDAAKNLYSKTALEISNQIGGVICNDAELGEPDGQSFGIYFQYRAHRNSDDSGVVFKKSRLSPSQMPSGETGYDVTHDGSTGRFYFNFQFPNGQSTSAYTYWYSGDGDWHWGYVKFDTLAELLSFFGSTSPGNNSNISSILANVEAEGLVVEILDQFFQFGGTDGATNGETVQWPIQIGYMAFFKGAQAEAFTRDHGDAMWLHGTSHADLYTTESIVWSRPDRVGCQVGKHYSHIWSGSGSFDGTQVNVPLQWVEGYTNESKLGLAVYEGFQTKIGHGSRLDEGWTTSNAAVDPRRLVSERGMLEMDVVRTTASGGYIHKDSTTVISGGPYTLTVWAAVPDGTHDVDIGIYETGGTLITTLTLEAVTARPKRYSFFFENNAVTVFEVRLYGRDSSSEGECGFHGLTIVPGEVDCPTIYTNKGLDEYLSCDDHWQFVDYATTSKWTSPDTGVIQAAYAYRVSIQDNNRLVAAVHGDTNNNNDARHMRVLPSGQQDCLLYNNIGTLSQDGGNHTGATVNEEVFRSFMWNRLENLQQGAYSFLDKIEEPAASQTLTGTNSKSTNGHTRLYIGHSRSADQFFNGNIRLIRLFPSEVHDVGYTYAGKTLEVEVVDTIDATYALTVDFDGEWVATLEDAVSASDSVSAVLTQPNALTNVPLYQPPTAWAADNYMWSSKYATDWWRTDVYDEGYRNLAGSVRLMNPNTEFGLTGQECHGIFNGTSWQSLKCWEVKNNGGVQMDAYLEASGDSNVLDSNGQDICIRLAFKAGRRPPTNTFLVHKRTGNTTGYSIAWIGATGSIIATVDDGTNTQSVTLAVNHADGDLHFASLYWDDSLKELSFKSDLAEDLDNATTITGPLSNSAYFTVCRAEINVVTSVSSEYTQVLAVGGCVGDDAAAMFAEDFFLHGTDPNNWFTSPARNSVVNVPVGDGKMARYSVDRLAWGWHDAITYATKSGLFSNKPTTNLITSSEDFSGWTGAITLNADHGNNPWGFRLATLFTATAANQERYTTFNCGVDTYNGSVYVRSANKSEDTVMLRLFDVTNGVYVTSTNIQVYYHKWTRINISALMGAGCVQGRFHIRLPNAGSSVWVTGAQVALGDNPAAYVYTSGVIAASVGPQYSRTDSAGVMMQASAGQSTIEYVQTHARNAQNQRVFTMGNATNNVNRHDVYLLEPNLRTAVYDNVGSSIAEKLSSPPPGDGLGQFYKYVVRWDDGGALKVGGGVGVQYIIDDGTPENDVITWTSGETNTKITLGCWHTYGSIYYLEGFISNFVVHDLEN